MAKKGGVLGHFACLKHSNRGSSIKNRKCSFDIGVGTVHDFWLCHSTILVFRTIFINIFNKFTKNYNSGHPTNMYIVQCIMYIWLPIPKHKP